MFIVEQVELGALASVGIRISCEILGCFGCKNRVCS